MRNNQPITQVEHVMPPGVTLVSHTDAKSQILYANDAFVHISGYDRDELVGQAHNIVRHPDMPEAAFADLWATVKRGRPWTGVVKNRRKDGAHYWVRANVSPRPDGGYLSVRMRPSPGEVEQAGALYAGLRAGHRHLLSEGRVFQDNWRSRLRLCMEGISIRQRFLAWSSLSTALFATAVAMGWFGYTDPAGYELLVAGGLLIAMPLGLNTLNHLKQGFGYANDSARAIAAGDLMTPVKVLGTDELGTLLAQMSIMRNNLQELIAEILQASRTLGVDVGTLGAASENAFKVAERQSDASGAIAAAVEEFSVSISQVKEYAETARQVTEQSVRDSASSARVITNAAAEMQQVAEVVHEAAVQIHELEGLSDKITSVVDVIRDVAEQTNLLALNAAIEAARAGEQGRGFAVVADEVRKLAERTRTSSGEIDDMISRVQVGAKAAAATMEAGVDRVRAGVKLSEEARHSISEIQQEQALVMKSVDEIGRALHEQTLTSQDIAGRVEHVSRGAEALAKSSQVAHDSARKLQAVADKLNVLAGNFRAA